VLKERKEGCSSLSSPGTAAGNGPAMNSTRGVKRLPNKAYCKDLQSKRVSKTSIKQKIWMRSQEVQLKRNGDTCSSKSFPLNAFRVASGESQLLKDSKRQ